MLQVLFLRNEKLSSFVDFSCFTRAPLSGAERRNVGLIQQ